jgi:putative DNA primase/helicase
VCADLPSEHLAGTSVFKALTGGDDVSGEYKFKDSFEFTPFARLVFSANAPPRSSDSSEGFFRRWVTIPFERTFSADDIVPAEELDARLAQPSELSGLLNKALDAWPQVRRHGVTLSQSMQAAMDEFRATTDSLIVWLDHETTDLPDSFVTKDDLRAAYNRHAASKGMPPLTPNAMTTALRKRRPNIREGQRTVNGAVKYCWLGIGLVTR